MTTAKTPDARPVSCPACGWQGREDQLIGEGDWIDVYCPSCDFKVRDPSWDAALWRVQGLVPTTRFIIEPTPHLPKQTLLNIAKLARLDAKDAKKEPERAAKLEALAKAAEEAATS